MHEPDCLKLLNSQLLHVSASPGRQAVDMK
jgi:hypothetical protein